MTHTLPADVIHEIFGHLRIFTTCSKLTFGYIHDPFGRLGNRSTLLNAALACRAFVEPALDSLWWDMDDLVPLFALFPTYSLGGEWNCGKFTGPVLDADLKRYISYARRIKAFEFVQPLNIHASALTQISRRSGSSCLLPSLRYLVSHIGHQSLLYLASPRLQSFSLKPKSAFNTDDSATVCSFCDIISRESPELDHLYLTISHSSYLPFIRMVPNLKELGIARFDVGIRQFPSTMDIDSGFFRHLASSSTLKTLLLRGVNTLQSGPEEPLSHPTVATFPTLQTLTFWDGPDSIVQVTNLLRNTSFPTLQNLEICPDDWDWEYDKPDWKNFYCALSNATSSPFTSLSILDNSGTLCIPCPVLDTPELQALNLTSLILDIRFPVAQEHINTVVYACPRLNTLVLNTYRAPEIGFSALIDLAKGLSRLDDLKLCINCDDHLSPEEVPFLDHHLSHLVFYGEEEPMDVPNPLNFARCVDKLFPWLTSTDFRDEPCGTDDLQKKWRKVGRIVEALQCARRIERARCHCSS